MSIATEIEALKTNITNAYTSVQTKGGTVPTNKNTENLATAIDSITTGGGGTSVVEAEKKDINFYDYDGTRLYSWTLAELAAKTELPALPTQTGLICQGWNWTLAELKEQNTKMNVGALYITDDGKTRLYIHLEKYGTTPYLKFATSIASGQTAQVEIDWGDGSNVETVEKATDAIPHTYSSEGDYVITLNPIGNTHLRLYGNNQGKNVISAGIYNASSRNYHYFTCLTKVELGKNVTSISDYAFAYTTNLKSISITEDTDLNGQRAFCYSGISFVAGAKNFLGDSEFNYSALRHFAPPPSLASLNSYVFAQSLYLEDCYLPKNAKLSTANYFLQGCFGIKDIVWSYETLSGNCFYQCQALVSVQCLNNVTEVSNAFSYCYSLRVVAFLANTSIPTLSSSSGFGTAPADYQIVVPDTLYDEWITATNWATIASHIVKASEWEG